MPNRTRTLNPSRIPNVAKYAAVAAIPGTWAKMVNATDFNGPNGCWEWKQVLNEGGYGLMAHHEYGNVLAHRLALHVVGRPVPADLTVDHLCRNRKCVNPEHMEMVTRTENTMRGDGCMAINARKTHCIHGHEFTPKNTYIGKPRTKTGNPTRTCRTCVRNRLLNRS